MTITKRLVKGSALTLAELDDNFTHLDRIETTQTTGTSSPISPDRTNGAIIKVPTLAGGITLNIPSNMTVGQTCYYILQGGGSSPSYAAGFDFGSATAPTMAAASTDCVIVSCLMTATGKLKCSYGGTHTWEA